MTGRLQKIEYHGSLVVLVFKREWTSPAVSGPAPIDRVAGDARPTLNALEGLRCELGLSSIADLIDGTVEYGVTDYGALEYVAVAE